MEDISDITLEMKNITEEEFSYLKDIDKIYLDSAATSQKPKCVSDAIKEAYDMGAGNAHSKMHYFANTASDMIEGTRRKVAEYINADESEIVFTKSATESLNIAISSSVKNYLEEDENVLITILEHHANIVPYQEAIYDKFKEKEQEEKENENENKEEVVSKYLRYATLDENYLFDYDDFERKLDENTKIIGITGCSNVTGEDIDFEKINEIISRKCIKRPIIIVDATQLVAHKKVDVKKIMPDYLAFSAHKMYGPYGVGILYIRKELVKETKPLVYGGDMIEYVFKDYATYLDDIHRFEGGTQNPADIYALGSAISFVQKMQIENITKYLKELTDYAYAKLKEIEEIIIYSNNSNSLISFTIKNIHAHDVASILDSYGFAIRAGHHCAMPLHNAIKEVSTNRVSFGIYNTKEDIDRLVDALKKIIAMLG